MSNYRIYHLERDSLYWCSFHELSRKIVRGVEVGVLVFNVTFNNISAISLQPVLLVEETGVPGENHRHDTSH